MKRLSGFACLALLGASLGAAAVAGADEKTVPASGWVRLPLPEYERLVRAGRRPLDKPPLDAAITSSVSVLNAETEAGAEADKDTPRLLTTLELVSLSDKPQTLALPDLGVVYAAESAGEGAAVATSEAGNLELRLAHRGRYVVRLRSVPARDERGGAVALTWSVPDSPSNRFSGTLPRDHENVTLTGGSVSITAPVSGPVRIAGTLRRGEAVRLSYGMAASRAPEEKLLASASESRLYRVGEKSLGVASRVRVEVLRGTLREFAVEADPDLAFVSAWAAENTVTSFERDPAQPGRFHVTLARGVAGGTVEMFWLLERPIGGRPADASGRSGKAEEDEFPLPDVGLPDFLRGETAVAVTSPRPLVLDEAKGKREGYERVDESDLPSELREMADATVLLALRRVGSAPPSVTIRVLSFPDAAGLAGVIDRGRVLTIGTRDGTRVDRWQLELQARESVVRIPLPANAVLWSLQVDGKPTRPLTENGELVVALGRGEKASRSRRIEIVLATPGALVITGRGTPRIEMPKLPFPMTHVDWDLLLPETAQYRYAGGSVAPAAERVATRFGEIGGVVGGANFYADALTVSDSGSGSGRLSGRVLDATGGALPGATVTVVRQEGGFRQTQSANERGFFLFTGVPEGTYRVISELSGFQTGDRFVTLSEGANLGADLSMPFLTAQESVTVEGGSPGGVLGMDQTAANLAAKAAKTEPESRPAPRHKDAKEPNRQTLSDEERASLQRTAETGIAAIPVELPTEGKRLHFEGNLLIDEAAFLELQVRPVKRGIW